MERQWQNNVSKLFFSLANPATPDSRLELLLMVKIKRVKLAGTARTLKTTPIIYYFLRKPWLKKLQCTNSLAYSSEATVTKQNKISTFRCPQTSSSEKDWSSASHWRWPFRYSEKKIVYNWLRNMGTMTFSIMTSVITTSFITTLSVERLKEYQQSLANDSFAMFHLWPWELCWYDDRHKMFYSVF